MGVNSLPKTVTRQLRGCDLNPGPSAPESGTLTTRLPNHPCAQKSRSTVRQMRGVGAEMLRHAGQSCPWVGLTHGFGWLGWVEIFQFLVGWVVLGLLQKKY